MAIAALTGKDTIKINGRILNEFADGDVAVLTFPNDLMQVKTGKNGNSIFGFSNTGRQCELVLKVIRGGADDKFLNNLLALMIQDPSIFTLLTGEFSKNVGDGAGNVIFDVYILSGGVFKKSPEVTENAEGDVKQAIAEWHFIFSNGPRIVG